MLPTDALIDFDRQCATIAAEREAAAAPAEPPAPEAAPISLPGGATWYLRATPDPVRYTAWVESVRTGEVTAETWALLLAAYDAGWDVCDEAGVPLPSPAAAGAGFATQALPTEVATFIGDWLTSVVATSLERVSESA